jgi:TolA-binding protein
MKSMTQKLWLSTAVALLTLNAASAFAEPRPRDPGVNARQHTMNERVRQGVRSGELTRNEAQGLREDRREIRQLEREYKSDGELTRDERRDLHQQQNEFSRSIYQEKHDDERR